mmetsp:Transcript_51945/g.118486  ORF Transcript_51945/g.118486 Transcript_51945/m.118486 type:complete len:107 (+) Transcript_51945:560-880(+)
MRTLTTAGALMGPYYQYLATSCKFLTDNGVDPEVAAAYLGDLLLGVAHDSAGASTPQRFTDLVEEQTPGGINLQMVQHLQSTGAYDELYKGMGGVLERLNKAAAQK